MLTAKEASSLSKESKIVSEARLLRDLEEKLKDILPDLESNIRATASRGGTKYVHSCKGELSTRNEYVKNLEKYFRALGYQVDEGGFIFVIIRWENIK